MGLRLPARLRALGIALLVATVLLVAGRQIAAPGWYSANSAFRAQTAALLDGHLALSHAPEAVFHDFVWTDGSVQQVWGLGAPAWQLPFELAGRAIGVSPFPDRIPLLLWLALMIYVLVRAWGPRREATEPWWIGAGAVLLTALLPPFVTLLRGRVGVYEETAIYAYAAALMLLGGIVRVHATRSRWRFLVLLAFAGLVGFIRPTTWCYGLATAVVASAMWLSVHGRRGLAVVAIGGALFCGGGAALYATNAARFGNGFEFGHRLNVQSLPGNLYATRFSYPMQRASIGEATLELVTSLFDRPEQRARGSFYQKNLHHGVSKKPRWREYYFTTYGWAYLPLLVVGLALGFISWRRRLASRDAMPVETAAAQQARWLVGWALIALVPMLGFYLRAPFMSSRYQLDLAPGFAALLVIAWSTWAHRMATRQRGPMIACGLLVGLWLVATVTAKIAEPRSADPIDRAAATRGTALITDAVRAARTFPLAYDLADPMLPVHTDLVDTFDRDGEGHHFHGQRTVDSEQWTVTESVGGVTITTHRPPPTLYLNLYRWNLDTGQMPPATFAFVEDPRFIELEVSVLEGPAPTDWSREVRVAVGLTHLKLVGATPASRGTRLRFEAPHLPQGVQVAFFAFGPDTELNKPTTRIAVHRIQWR
jgi:hypothetical protein